MIMRRVLRYYWLICLINGYEQAPSCLPIISSSIKSTTASVSDQLQDAEWQTYGDQFVNDYNITPLSTDTKPVEYWLKVTPNLEEGTFKGNVTIEISVDRNTNTIELNCEQLTVEDVTITAYNKHEFVKQKSNFSLDSKNNVLKITTSKRLNEASRYKINVIFAGYLYRNNPFGFAVYSDKFKTVNGDEFKDSFMAETQLYPFFARKVFPCYDELRYRTPFMLTVVVRNNAYTVVSNLPTTIGKDEEGKHNVIFKMTEPIPVNIVYYAIFDGEYGQVNRQGKYFVWTMKRYINQLSYAVQDLEQIVEKIKSLFPQQNTTDLLNRVDLVAPIADNNQLEFLRFMKKNVLCDSQYCSQNYQQEVTRNIVRQVWNKWSTNYASVQFWNHLWLTDRLGFYYEFKLTDMIKSRWRMTDLHGSIIFQSTLYDDLRNFFYPLNRNILTEKKIFQMVYSPSIFTFYNNKASLIIRMLEHIVGESIFNKAVSWFLSFGRLQKDLITPANLWKEIETHVSLENRELGLPKFRTLSNVMDLFTRQTGYPLITVRISEEKHAQILVKQEPYVNSTADGKIIGSKWIVPITMTTRNNANFLNTTPIAWSVADEEVAVPIAIEKDEWYIFNLQNTVYCRTNYTLENWSRLIDQLESDPKKIHSLNRAQLIADSHVLAADAKLDVSIPIKLIAYLPKEDDPVVWLVALDQFKLFYAKLTKNLRPLYKKFFQKYLKHEYRRTVGFEIDRNDDHVTKIWKNEMFNFLCWIGDEDCIREAEKMYNEHEKDLTNIDPDLLYVVICTMFRGANWEKVKITLNKITKNDNFYLHEMIQKVSFCQYSPWNSEFADEKSQMYEKLLIRVLNGDEEVGNLVNGILTSWDTVLPMVEIVYWTILKWNSRSKRKGAEPICNDLEVDRMASFIKYFHGKIIGDAEIETFIEITKNVQLLFLSNRYKYMPLLQAVESVARVTETKYACIDEDLLKSLIGTNEYEDNYSVSSPKIRVDRDHPVTLSEAHFDTNVSSLLLEPHTHVSEDHQASTPDTQINESNGSLLPEPETQINESYQTSAPSSSINKTDPSLSPETKTQIIEDKQASPLDVQVDKNNMSSLPEPETLMNKDHPPELEMQFDQDHRVLSPHVYKPIHNEDPPLSLDKASLVNENKQKFPGLQYRDRPQKCDSLSLREKQFHYRDPVSVRKTRKPRLSDTAVIIDSMMPFGQAVGDFSFQDSSFNDGTCQGSFSTCTDTNTTYSSSISSITSSDFSQTSDNF